MKSKVRRKAVSPAKTKPVSSRKPKVAGPQVQPQDETEVSVARAHTQESELVRARHTIRLEQLYQFAVSGFERSCESEFTEKRTAEGNGTGDAAGSIGKKGSTKVKAETIHRSNTGDVRFLIEARTALAEIRRIWNIESTANAAGTFADAISRIRFESASEADLTLLSNAHEILERLAESA